MAKSKRKVHTGLRWLSLVLVTMFLIGITTAAMCGVAFAMYINKYINPNLDINLENFRMNLTTFIYATDKATGEMREIEQLYDTENRVWVDFDKIPQELKDAFVAVEDNRFYEHNGVDWKRTIGAAVNFVIPFRSNFGGGSTITQQLIKNVTDEDEVSAKRKIQEIMRALNLENQYEKDDILELYLNTIFLGNRCNGVATAAQTYFGKEVSELTLAECASIACITKNPSKYDPFRFPENNKERQELVLDLMVKYEKISQEECDAAKAQKLDFKKAENTAKQESKQSYFVDQVINDVLRDLQEEKGYSEDLAKRMLYSGGLRIHTTLDTEIQAKMDAVFTNDESFPDIKAKDGTLPEAAMVIMDPYTGDVVALTGGRGEKTANRVWNRATQSKRQPGSVIKPLSVYAPALDYGIITMNSVFDDAPKSFDVKATGWPKNSTNGSVWAGRMSLMKAVEVSNNTVPVDILMTLTPERSFNFMTTNLGVTSLVKSQTTSSGKVQTDIGLASLALGGLTKGMSPLEMTAAYSTFVNDGKYIEPRTYTKVLDSTGAVVLEKKQDMHNAMKKSTADYMLNLLQNVVTGPQGTGRKAQIKGIATAGKTGTTTKDYDRWFVGLTPYYVGSVWFGYDENITVPSLSTNPALALWKAVMDPVHEDLENREFDSTEGMVKVSYCLDSGGIPTHNCSLDPRGGRVATVYMLPEDKPTSVCTMHKTVEVDKETFMIANEYCPEENRSTVALLDYKRLYPREGVRIKDQQYLLPYEAQDGLFPAVPFANSDGRPPYNTLCTVHTEETILPEEPVDPDNPLIPPEVVPPDGEEPGGGGEVPGEGGETTPPGEEPGGGEPEENEPTPDNPLAGIFD